MRGGSGHVRVRTARGRSAQSQRRLVELVDDVVGDVVVVVVGHAVGGVEVVGEVAGELVSVGSVT